MSDPQRILIVDDDPDIRALLADFIGRHGYAVDTARNGAAMHTALARGHFDLIVLDIMMPGEDGLSLCRTLRAQTQIPVIFLTAAAEETDRIIGLEMGADDYVVKPFAPRELLARVRAVLRRASALVPVHRSDPSERLAFEGWQLMPARRELYDTGGALVSLTAGEFDLLVALARNAGQVLSRDQLLDLTKGRSAAAFDRSVDVQLSRLRRKLEVDPAQPLLIKTVRGGGYLFAPAVAVLSDKSTKG
ncbi:MAG TPA: response regulator [Pseudomonadales bacterium]|jgi:two-component system, OmpR family, response regulator|nr:response regulator [Pseudomonadales bacterium]